VADLQGRRGGLSKAIIENYLLISGVPTLRYASTRTTLPKLVLSSGVRQFGIGGLSYFDRDLVQVRTRRSNLAEDTDPTGWFFETEGVGAFGELRQCLVAAGHGENAYN